MRPNEAMVQLIRHESMTYRLNALCPFQRSYRTTCSTSLSDVEIKRIADFFYAHELAGDEVDVV